MNLSFQFAGPFLSPILAASLGGIILALVVLLLTLCFRLSPAFRCSLWLLVLLRLAIPFSIPAHWPVQSRLPVSAADAPVGSVSVPSFKDLPVRAPAALLSRHPAKLVQPVSWARILLRVYLVGLGLFLLRILIATFRLHRKLQTLTPVDDPSLLQLLLSCSHSFHISNPPLLCLSNAIPAPALVGFFHPRLLLPANLLPTLTHRELRLIFLHELVHLRRRDVLQNYLAALVQALHWFNPFAHLAAARLRAERELACDEQVLRLTTDADHRLYGQTILKLLEAFSRPVPSPGAVGILENSCSIKRRIAMIARFDRRPTHRFLALAALLSLGALGLAAPAAPKQPATHPAGTRQNSPHENVMLRVGRAPDNHANATIEAAVTRPLPEVKFDGVALKDAIDFLRDVSGLNIVIDGKELDTLSVSMDAPVSLHVRNVSLSEVLRLVLRQAGIPNGYQIEEGVIVIPASAAVDRQVVTKAYDVRDLVGGPLLEVASSRVIDDLSSQLANSEIQLQIDQDKYGTHSPQFTEATHLVELLKDQLKKEKSKLAAAPAAAPASADNNVSQIVDLLKENLGATTSPFVVKSFKTKIVITANDSTHREVEKILDLLRDEPLTAPIQPAK